MIKVVQVGLGPVGQMVVRYALDRESIKVIGAADPAPDKVGRDLGELCGLKPMGMRVSSDLKSALGRKKADVALLTTFSDIGRIEPQITEIARAGLNVVSTCEELSFPWHTAPEAARRIDTVCKKHGVTCVGTGVNPGFLMDFLPLVLTGVCRNVKRVVVRRMQDAASRRIPFQQKIGVGLTPAEFRKKKASGKLRHVGLTESMHMIAHRMGWALSRTTETLRPVIAERAINTGHAPIRPGTVCGIEQVGRAYLGKKQVIRLEFRATVGEPEPCDSVEITGEPNLRSVIPGGVNGDIATCAIVLNAAREVVAATPGLKTMADLPPATFSSS